MKYTLILLFVLSLHFSTFSQSKIVYNAFKVGLSMRESPSAQSKTIVKIPYGEKLTLIDVYADTVAVVNEGMDGYWNIVEYQGKKGYVVGIYLLEMPPPKANVKSMKEYFAQLSAAAGAAVTTTKYKQGDEGYSQFKKQLYKNGCEYHEATFYESNSSTYFLPNITLQQGFILVRLISEFKDAFSSSDIFPRENKIVKVNIQGYESDREIKVVQSDAGNWIDKIIVNFEDGAFYTFEMFQLDGQLVISFGGGV